MASRRCQFLPEWAPQSGVMLTWPHPATDWAPLLDRVEPVYREIAREILYREGLLIVARDPAHRKHIEAVLAEDNGMDLARIRWALAPANDTWARDHGPITVLGDDGRPRLFSFRFNGWGEKYAHDLDDAINARLAEQRLFTTPMTAVDLVLEGGSLEVDGQGTLLTTTQCLLMPRRNPGLSRADIEAALIQHLCVERVLWLEHGHLAGDDTDAHIDTLARFCDDDTIAYMSCEDPADEHFAPLKAMEAELQQARTRDGRPYRLVPLPMPAPILNAEGDRLPASYANFLIINDAVLVPVYRDANDTRVLADLDTAFPNHEIIGIDCRPLIEQFGSLHCITMQLPEGVLR
ncbi:MAG TPA: agmatine deiminase family protein [Thioalkalivibrio sp.]|nr:agmatine deiminase family protein [Thioalkalivibrio sp.]